MRRNVIRASAVLMLIPFALTGCLFGPEKKTSMPIDPPPAKEAQKMLNALPVQGEATATKQKAKGTELYFLTDAGYVVPYEIDLPTVSAPIKEAMKYMVQGGPEEAMLPQGFKALLPKGTVIKGVSVLHGTATVDFSKEFLNYDAKAEDQLLSAITWTLTSFPNVQRVNIRVEGRNLEAMPKGKVVAQGLTRAHGINVEVADGVNITNSMPVTLYFLAQTPDNATYYVPITRIVNYNNQVAQTTLSELIKGPLLNSHLVGALDTTTEVNSVQVKNGVVTADFGNELLQYSTARTASEEALESILLSLTENTGASKVKILVNGKDTFSTAGAKGENWNKPVSRPQMINPTGL